MSSHVIIVNCWAVRVVQWRDRAPVTFELQSSNPGIEVSQSCQLLRHTEIPIFNKTGL
jgi:hypothetical protein